MLKTTRSLNSAPRLEADDDEIIGGDCKTDDKNLSKKSNNIKFGIQMHIGATRKPPFLISGTKKAFN